MRFTVGIKCPDSLEMAIEEQATNEIGSVDSEEFNDLVNKAKKVAGKWFKHGEYIRVTIDTDLGTCVVESV